MGDEDANNMKDYEQILEIWCTTFLIGLEDLVLILLNTRSAFVPAVSGLVN
jgi:hypothetical protein